MQILDDAMFFVVFFLQYKTSKLTSGNKLE